jgi:proliferating cell nuclear antigen
MPLILEVKTIHTNAFRSLIGSLKGILTDVNIEFFAKTKKSKGRIKIMAMNPKRTVLIHLKLDAHNFETFMCNKSKIIIGVNMSNLFELIRTIDNTEILTLFIDDADDSKLGIKIEDLEKKTVTTHRLKLMELGETNLDIPKMEFDVKITIPSSDFHKLCSKMNNISESIEIQNKDNTLILKGEGDIADQETVLNETTNCLKIEHSTNNLNNPNIVKGKYELKHLIMFTKCTSLCANIDLYMTNDFPLIIKYTIESLGNIILCITPFIDED